MPNQIKVTIDHPTGEQDVHMIDVPNNGDIVEFEYISAAVEGGPGMRPTNPRG